MIHPLSAETGTARAAGEHPAAEEQGGPSAAPEPRGGDSRAACVLRAAAEQRPVEELVTLVQLLRENENAEQARWVMYLVATGRPAADSAQLLAQLGDVNSADLEYVLRAAALERPVAELVDLVNLLGGTSLPDQAEGILRVVGTMRPVTDVSLMLALLGQTAGDGGANQDGGAIGADLDAALHAANGGTASGSSRQSRWLSRGRD